VGLCISSDVRHKLATRHSVAEADILECFSSRDPNKNFLEDTRADNRTNPKTLWFVSETDVGRTLKIVFIYYAPDRFVIKTAYEANDNEKRIYGKFA
jgi:hypothetical protein